MCWRRVERCWRRVKQRLEGLAMRDRGGRPCVRSNLSVARRWGVGRPYFAAVTVLIPVRPRLTLGDLAGYEIDTGKVHACKSLNMALRN